MQNSRSAIDRVKNSLSYKLGFAILGYIARKDRIYTLPYKLYKIRKQYFKDQELYKQVVKIFPELTYCKLESCEDYNESLRYRCHLSYMLGEALIKAHKTWYKGGYFKLFYSLKEKYRLYHDIQEIIGILPKSLHYHFYNLIIKNYKISIQDLTRVIKQHRDYKPIIENIFHNFDFFIQYFEFIQSWLLSDEFERIYKQEDHPYPPLFDPQKLNNENEKVNYKNISTELSWEMNLPLPYIDKLIVSGHGVGLNALEKNLNINNVDLIRTHTLFPLNGKERYEIIYNKILSSNKRIKFLCLCEFGDYDFGMNMQYKQKFFKLIYLYSDAIICLVRDPISNIVGILNRMIKKEYNIVLNLERSDDFYNIIKDSISMLNNRSNVNINIDYFKRFVFVRRNILDSLMAKKVKIDYLDYNDICLNNIDCLIKVSDKRPCKKVISNIRFILPIVVQTRIGKLRVDFTNNKFNEFDITSMFFENSIFIDDMQLSIFSSEKKDTYLFLKEDVILIINLINRFYMYFNDIKVSEDSYLNYLISKNYLTELKKNLDYELQHIIQHRPDIVASWKYYQEFEKICKELDKKE